MNERAEHQIVPPALASTRTCSSVHAPETHFSGFGRQWWPVADRRPEVMEGGARNAERYLDAFIDAELARLELPPERLALALSCAPQHLAQQRYRPLPAGEVLQCRNERELHMLARQ